MARRIPQNHNYRTACPAAIKVNITALENAALAVGSASSEEAKSEFEEHAQVARYNLERTILTCIEAAREGKET